MLEQTKRQTSFERRVAVGTWVFVVLLSTAFLVIGGLRNETLTGIWFGVLACFWLTLGACVLVNQNMNARSLAVLAELEATKQQLVELQRLVREGRG